MHVFLRYILLASLVVPAAARSSTVSAEPTATTLTLYDTGLAVVNELRRLELSGGSQEIRIRGLPSQLYPDSVSFLPVAGTRDPFDLVSQRFENDLDSAQSMLARYRGQPIRVRESALVREGVLLNTPEMGGYPSVPAPLIVGGSTGEVTVYPRADALEAIEFPGARSHAVLEPTLIWQVKSASQGPANIRLAYQTAGLSWKMAYSVLLDEPGTTARLDARVRFLNRSGASFTNARVRLVSSERGSLDPLFSPERGERRALGDTPPQRYLYGAEKPVLERAIASLGGLSVHSVQDTVSLAEGQETVHLIAGVRQLPVRQFYVYDGVRFDRFQRNRRNDWSYGTEFHTVVDTFLEFDNEDRTGLGRDLPPGLLRVLQHQDDETVDMLAETMLPLIPAGAKGSVRMGPARGLRGERERTGYTEVRPNREYEESFEIRLQNQSSEEREIRVVERLYRWPDFEIVKADFEYREIGPQTIEFRPVIKAGGSLTLRYTVRYRW